MKKLCISFMLIFLVMYCYGNDTNSYEKLIYEMDSSGFERPSYNSGTFNRDITIYHTNENLSPLIAAKWIHDTNNYLKGLKRAMGFASMESKLSYESNIFKIEEFKDTWDVAGDISIIIGPALSIIPLFIPSDNNTFYTEQVRNGLINGSIGLGVILKGVFSEINKIQEIEYNKTFSEALSRVTVARQSFNDTKVRIKKYEEIYKSLDQQITALDVIDKICFMEVTEKTTEDEIKKQSGIIRDYLSKEENNFSDVSDQIERLGLSVITLYDDLAVSLKYYKEIFEEYGYATEEDNPFIEMEERIIKEKKDFIDNGESKFFNSLREFKMYVM